MPKCVHKTHGHFSYIIILLLVQPQTRVPNCVENGPIKNCTLVVNGQYTVPLSGLPLGEAFRSMSPRIIEKFTSQFWFTLEKYKDWNNYIRKKYIYQTKIRGKTMEHQYALDNCWVFDST